MPDKRLGERICAYVVLKKEVNSLKLEELLEYMEKEKIPKRYWPEHLEIIDKIPRTDSGKVKKNLLAKDLKVRMSRQEESSWKGENSVQEDQEKQQNQGLCAPS
ncbi:AMP-binding enzyme [Clostridium ljungdahlii]